MKIFGNVEKLFKLIFQKGSKTVTIEPASQTLDTSLSIPDVNAASDEIVLKTTAVTMANKTLTSPVLNTGVSGSAIDTDTSLAANSDTKLASQKATKAYADAVSTSISNHISNTTGAHAASAIANTPAGNVAATTVQAAINELDSEKLDKSGGTVTGNVTFQGDLIVEGDKFTLGNPSSTGFNYLRPTTASLGKTISIPDTDHFVGSNNATTLTSSGTSSLTIPTTGTLATLAGTETLTNKNIDGGTASANNKLKLPEDTYANLVSLAGKTEGQIFYANDVDKVYYYNGTALIEVGSGSGTGKKNYILNPSAATDVSKWTASNLTVTKDTSTAIPRETTTGTAFKLISTSTSATFLSDAMLLDDTDLSKKLGVELAINVADSSNWTIDILASATAGGTYARLPLSTDVAAVTTLPATVGVFKTSVDMVAATPYIKLRLTSAATAKTAYFSDILVTPDGNTVVGPVIEEWKDTNLTMSSTGSKTFTVVSKYRRVGDSMELIFNANGNAVASATTGNFFLIMPSGLSINTSKIVAYETVLGVTQTNGLLASGQFDRTTGIIAANSTQLYFNKPGTGVGYTIGDLNIANAVYFYGRFTVPIAEWAGSGTVNLAQNDEEYASNGDTSVTTNTAAFAYGSLGSSFPSGTAAAAFDKTVRFQGTVQQSDSFIIEINTGLGWRPLDAGPLSSVSRLQYQNGVSYGLDVVDILDSTSIKIRFGKYCFANGATYGANGIEWSSVSASFKWRVRKTSGGKAIGFSHVVPGVSAGLVPAAGLPGRTDGGAVGAGYVGDVVNTSTNSSGTSMAHNTWATLNTLPSVPIGNYMAHIYLCVENQGGLYGNAGAKIFGAFSTSSSGTTNSYDTLTLYKQGGDVGAYGIRTLSLSVPVVITAAANQYLRAMVESPLGSGTAPIAFSKIVLVRIA